MVVTLLLCWHEDLETGRTSAYFPLVTGHIVSRLLGAKQLTECATGTEDVRKGTSIAWGFIAMTT